MKADIRWLDDPGVFSVNQLPAHSDHAFYRNQEEMQARKNTLAQSLNGKWRFHYSVNAVERPTEFYQEGYLADAFDEIKVPCHIELKGYDKIHYINTMYPWEGHVFRRPAYSMNEGDAAEGSFSGAKYNPVGSYIKRFDLEKGLLGKRVCICFEGVEQAMYIWLNGTFIGYAEDSFTPSEFDLTPHLKEKDNILAVEVHKRSTAAYLEDQDFFRFFGIFRNVTLYAKPKIHLEDMWAKTVLDEDNHHGSLALELNISFEESPGDVKITLCDEENRICLKKRIQAAARCYLEPEVIQRITPWDNRKPYLYTLQLELFSATGELVEVVPYRIGFRRIEIQNKVILLNGKRLILKGVNRHEWSAENGRCLSIEEMGQDIDTILKNNINAVRTSHYPNQIPWYYMCDENGIYLMAETNLESHGSWQKMGMVEPSWNVPGSIPEWKGAVLDRAKTHFETFKNHVSILFWSLGNESYAGKNILMMNRFYKEADGSRLVHYEGVFHHESYQAEISDVESRMYEAPDRIKIYLDNKPAKPFILCEYMHVMGNSVGGMSSYMELLDQYEMYQGGFIWDFIDQALFVTDEVTGQRVLRYGGDFDDRPSDYEFSGNGIVFADRTEKPAMQEVRYYYGRCE